MSVENKNIYVSTSFNLRPNLEEEEKLNVKKNNKFSSMYVADEGKCFTECPKVFPQSCIRNLEPNCQSCSFCSCSCSKIVTKSLHLPQNLCRPLKTFACVSLRYRKRCGGGVDGNTGSM